jgi:hypothetical protein
MAIFVSTASVRERRRADGTRSFAVLWRDPETGRQTSLTYDDEREARIAKELIEAAGGHAAEAARIAEAVRKPGPTVLEAMTEHTDLLTGVGAGTRSHYRRRRRRSLRGRSPRRTTSRRRSIRSDRTGCTRARRWRRPPRRCSTS